MRPRFLSFGIGTTVLLFSIPAFVGIFAVLSVAFNASRRKAKVSKVKLCNTLGVSRFQTRFIGPSLPERLLKPNMQKYILKESKKVEKVVNDGQTSFSENQVCTWSRVEC